MTKTTFIIEVTTPAPLLPDQHRVITNALAKKIKALEHEDRPYGNAIQRAFVVERIE
jgi:hypothetical protein